MLERLMALVLKEMQALLRDRQSRVLLIMPVVLQLALFPGAATLSVKNATLAVYNEDAGVESRELILRLSRAAAFTEMLLVHSEGQLADCIERQRALLAVRLPSDFSRKLVVGEGATLQVVIDGRRSNAGQIAQGYILDILQRFSQERAGQRGFATPTSRVDVRHWYNPNLEFKWFVLPNLVAVIMTSTVLIVSALSVAREKEQGTFDQLLVSPLTPGLILLGKTIPAIIVSLFQGTLILLGAILIYKVPFEGSFPLLYVVMVIYVVALVGFGFLIASICATQQQAFLGIFSFLMPAILLSGFASPVDNMPLWLQRLTWFNPVRHAMVMIKGIFLKDMRGSAVAEHIWPLLIIGAMTLTAAYWRFRRQTG